MEDMATGGAGEVIPGGQQLQAGGALHPHPGAGRANTSNGLDLSQDLVLLSGQQ